MITHHCTVASESAFCPEKKYFDAIMGPAKEATPCHPWLKFRRAAAYFGEPSTVMYELAATSRQDKPHPTQQMSQQTQYRLAHGPPMTNVQPTKPPYVA